MFSKMYSTLVLLAVLDLIVSESITFHGCESTTDTNNAVVQLSPCPKQPCEFKHGQTVDVKVTFTANQDESHLKTFIYGEVFGLDIPWAMPNSDGCKDQGITCPLKKGKTYTYHASFKVLPIYPKIKLTVKWKMDGGKNQFCFRFPMAIIDGIADNINTIG